MCWEHNLAEKFSSPCVSDARSSAKPADAPLLSLEAAFGAFQFRQIFLVSKLRCVRLSILSRGSVSWEPLLSHVHHGLHFCACTKRPCLQKVKLEMKQSAFPFLSLGKDTAVVNKSQNAGSPEVVSAGGEKK